MTDPDLARVIRIALAEHDVTLADVVRSRRLSYDRVLRILRGYRSPRPGELEELLGAVEELARGIHSPRCAV